LVKTEYQLITSLQTPENTASEILYVFACCAVCCYLLVKLTKNLLKISFNHNNIKITFKREHKLFVRLTHWVMEVWMLTTHSIQSLIKGLLQNVSSTPFQKVQCCFLLKEQP